MFRNIGNPVVLDSKAANKQNMLNMFFRNLLVMFLMLYLSRLLCTMCSGIY